MPDFFGEFSRNAKASPHSLALISSGGNIDYRTLAGIIDRVAGQAVSHGLNAGKVVHVETDNDDMRLLLFLGLMRAGLTVAFLHSAGRAFVETGVMPDIVVTDRSDRSAMAQRAGQVVRFSHDWFRTDAQTHRNLPDVPEYALLFASSGSTGRQKLILESRLNVEYNVDFSIDHLQSGDNIRLLTGIGETSHGTFPYYMVALQTGGSIVRLRRYSPEEIVSATCLLQPSYVKMAPMALVNVLRVLDTAPRRFRKVDCLNLAGAFCAPDTQRAALERYADRVLITYGATEVGQVARGEVSGRGSTDGAVIRVFDGMTVETIDEENRSLPKGREGEIRIKPPGDMVKRYLTKDGPSDVLRDGWFYPGDVGRVETSGQLVVTGRRSAVINLGGNKINPEAAESLLLGLAGVEDAAVAPVPGAHGFQAVCALIVSEARPTLEDLNRYLSEKGARFQIEKLRLVAEIPRNPNHKIDRPAVQQIADTT